MSSTHSDRVRAELEDVHLPMLDEAGLIDWDPETGRVTKGERFDEIESMLDRME